MSGIGSIYNLLDTGAGSFVYHLMILLALLAAVGISLVEYRRTRNPDQHRFLRAFSVLLLLRVPLLFGGPAVYEAAGNGPPDLPRALGPLLTYTLELSNLAVLWWAFLAPLLGRRWSRLFLVGSLLLTAGLSVAFLPSWYRASASLAYVDFWQQTVWDLLATLLALAAAALLTASQRRLGTILPAVSFTLLTSGHALALFGQEGAGRLINLIGYPLLAVAVYRAALQDLYAYRHELETLSGESLRQTRELLSLVKVSRALGESLDLSTILQSAVENIAHALEADRAAVLLADEDLEELHLASQFVPLERNHYDERSSASIPVVDYPLLDHVMRRKKQLILNPLTDSSRLRPLYELLGSHGEGPAILQPLVHQHNVLGALAVGRDKSKRPFGDSEARLCDSVALQLAAAVENARLYQNLTEALRVQQEEAGRREAILESITEGVIVTNSEGRAVLLNAAAEEILGVGRERVLGQPLQHLLEMAAADREVDFAQLPDLTSPLHVLFELQDKQVRVSAAPVRALDGETVGVVAALRDVTKEVQAEKAKRDFIAVISHELRTPLTAILGYTEALYSGMGGELTATQSRFTRTVHENARRMVAMANNLIALTDSERGHLQLEYGETDLALIIGEVVQSFTPLVQANQLEWNLDVEQDLPIIDGDSNRIRQVVANLVSNAINFTFPGGRITVGAGVVDRREESGPAYCSFWVQDTGIGIPADKQAIIWDRFSRADGPIKEEGRGLGLGLAIVKSLTEAHGGRVWVESVAGEGSSFTVLLPVRRPSPSLLEVGTAYPQMDDAVPTSGDA